MCKANEFPYFMEIMFQWKESGSKHVKYINIVISDTCKHSEEVTQVVIDSSYLDRVLRGKLSEERPEW